MRAAAVAVGVSRVIILVVTAVVTRVRRNRVRRQRDETPEDCYWREFPDLRRSQTSRGGVATPRKPHARSSGPMIRRPLVQRAVQNAVVHADDVRMPKRGRQVGLAGEPDAVLGVSEHLRRAGPGRPVVPGVGASVAGGDDAASQLQQQLFGGGMGEGVGLVGRRHIPGIGGGSGAA